MPSETSIIIHGHFWVLSIRRWQLATFRWLWSRIHTFQSFHGKRRRNRARCQGAVKNQAVGYLFSTQKSSICCHVLVWERSSFQNLLAKQLKIAAKQRQVVVNKMKYSSAECQVSINYPMRCAGFSNIIKIQISWSSRSSTVLCQNTAYQSILPFKMTNLYLRDR